MFILFLYVTKRNMMEYTIYIYLFTRDTVISHYATGISKPRFD